MGNSLDQSILESVEKYIGTIFGETDEEVHQLTRFQISIEIDNALSVLVQNGVGSHKSVLDNPELTWREFLYDGIDQNKLKTVELKDPNFARTFVGTSAVLAFDTPLPSVVGVLKDSKAEALYRARLEYDIIEY